MRASGPEKKAAVGTAVGKAVSGNDEGRRRRRNLSDVSVRSPRKEGTQQSKKARLVEDEDGDGGGEEALEVLEIDSRSQLYVSGLKRHRIEASKDHDCGGMLKLPLQCPKALRTMQYRACT